MNISCTNLFSFQQKKHLNQSKNILYERLHVDVKKALVNNSKKKIYSSKNINNEIEEWNIWNNLNSICNDIEKVEEEICNLDNYNYIHTRFMLLKSWTKP